MDLRKASTFAWAAALALNALALFLVFGYAPVERSMGPVQKIFYYHVPSAITAYTFIGLAFVFSVLYLWRDEMKWDTLAHTCAEVAWVFITVVLLSGPVWGRAAWGKWWVWEPRLTTALVLWLMYTAYFLLRLFSGHDVRTGRIAAVLAIVSAFNVPIVHWAITWWGSVVHPGKVALEPPMRLTFLVCIFAVLSLGASMGLSRYRIGVAEAEREASL